MTVRLTLPGHWFILFMLHSPLAHCAVTCFIVHTGLYTMLEVMLLAPMLAYTVT